MSFEHFRRISVIRSGRRKQEIQTLSVAISKRDSYRLNILHIYLFFPPFSYSSIQMFFFLSPKFLYVLYFLFFPSRGCSSHVFQQTVFLLLWWQIDAAIFLFLPVFFSFSCTYILELEIFSFRAISFLVDCFLLFLSVSMCFVFSYLWYFPSFLLNLSNFFSPLLISFPSLKNDIWAVFYEIL